MRDPLDISPRSAPGEWLSSVGPESDIVMSTRIRLARNVTDYPFLGRIEERQKADLERFLRERLERAKLGEKILYKNLTDASALDKQCLVERHLISRELAAAEGGRGVALGESETLSVMVNEEDHLRVQVLRSGFNPDAAWSQISTVDRQLESELAFCFSPQFGYLTACPTNAGTGMRVSVMLHLPALVMTKEIDTVFRAVTKVSLAVRGFYGEGTQASGDFYQISNQVTLGKSEEDVLKTVADHVPQIIQFERNVRERLLTHNRSGLEDRVWRAYGMLERARLITSEETMDYLSAVRLGVNLKLIDKVSIATVNELFILTQPAHLQKLEGRELETAERDELRAAYIRKRLAS